MKLSNAFNIATGALAAASAIPGRQADTSSNQLQHATRSPELAKREASLLDRGCRARLMEAFNNDAVYTVVSAENNLCSRWVGEVSKNCPDVQTLLPSENLAASVSIPDAFLEKTADPVLRGWVSSDGPTNKTISNCVASQFNKVVGDFKDDTWHKVQIGIAVGVGVSVASIAGATAYAIQRRRRAMNAERPVPLQNMNR